MTTVALRTTLPTIPISPRKSPGPSSAMRSPSRSTSARAVLDDEELVRELALARQLRALRDVDLVGVLGDRARAASGSESNSAIDRRLLSSMGRTLTPPRLQVEQRALALEAAAVAGQAARGPEHAVAGDDHGQRVAPVRGAHGPARARAAQRGGQRRVGRGRRRTGSPRRRPRRAAGILCRAATAAARSSAARPRSRRGAAPRPRRAAGRRHARRPRRGSRRRLRPCSSRDSHRVPIGVSTLLLPTIEPFDGGVAARVSRGARDGGRGGGHRRDLSSHGPPWRGGGRHRGTPRGRGALRATARRPATTRTTPRRAAGACSTWTPIRARSPAALGADPLLAPLVRRRPGLRVPGAVDGFEMAARAIVGQQVSVAGARTVLGRLVAEHGEPLAQPDGGLTHRFPARRGARGGRSGRVSLPAHARGGAGRRWRGWPRRRAPPGRAGGSRRDARALTAIRGVGPWTASYIAMRALGDPRRLPPRRRGHPARARAARVGRRTTSAGGRGAPTR